MIRFTTRDLIWLYFLLLIFEGALRKWIVPQFSSILLIIRDPVVILIYLTSFRSGIFPWNIWTLILMVIGILMFMVSLFLPESNLVVVCYGFRTNVLHLPLIFIIGKLMTGEHFLKMGKTIIKLILPMAILMAAQFLSAPDSWINIAAGGEGAQIEGTAGNIRPPGTFSYITGAAEFLALGGAFLIAYFLSLGILNTRQLVYGAIGICMALSVSISRLALSYSFLVVLMMFVYVFFRPHNINRMVGIVMIGVLFFVILLNFDFMQKGLSAFSDRVEGASQVEGGASGFFDRVLSDYITPIQLMTDIPLNGYGLGNGTSAGAHLISGESVFLLAEGEWNRVLLESGPILGIAFIGWRVLFTLWLGLMSLQAAISGYPFPILIFGACNQLLLIGQISRATTLGFLVFGAGMCLAAINHCHFDLQKRAQNRKYPVSNKIG